MALPMVLSTIQKYAPNKDDGDNDHKTRGAHVLKRRRRNLSHFGTDVVVEGLDPLWPGLQPPRKALVRRRCD